MCYPFLFCTYGNQDHRMSRPVGLWLKRKRVITAYPERNKSVIARRKLPMANFFYSQNPRTLSVFEYLSATFFRRIYKGVPASSKGKAQARDKVSYRKEKNKTGVAIAITRNTVRRETSEWFESKGGRSAGDQFEPTALLNQRRPQCTNSRSVNKVNSMSAPSAFP